MQNLAHISEELAPADCPLSARDFLRRVTRVTHEHLHTHPGFAAAAAGTIDIDDYRRLLARLFGFHVAIEPLLGISRARSSFLRQDLSTLGVADAEIDALPHCNSLPCFVTSAGRLGARYVLEGSALGGRAIARALDPLLGQSRIDGRRFFLGAADATGASWRAFVTELELGVRDRPQRREAASAAKAVFGSFAEWFSENTGVLT